MNHNELLITAYGRIQKCMDIIRKAQLRGQIKRSESFELLAELRAANGAAQQLDSLVAGNPAPKVGP